MDREHCIALMLLLEGGEANLKGDPGGHTKYGITQATLDRVRVSDTTLPANVADLTADQAAAIYRNVQWAHIRGDELPSALAPLVLNAAVNMGEPRAVMLLQECVGTTVDGAMGAATLQAVHGWRSHYLPGQTLAEEYVAHVSVRYATLDSAEHQFELGWFRRLMRVYTLAVTSP